MQVILDTSFLMDVAKFGIELDELRALAGPGELVIPEPVIVELKRIASSRGRAGRAAAIALRLIEHEKLKILKTSERDADEAILKLAGKPVMVATDDREMRKLLKRLGVKTIYLRGKKRLEMG
jgi:rRNA-processing protein FCF1